MRRAVLESLQEHTPLRTVTFEHTTRALDDLLDSAQRVTRSLLGVGNDPEQLPPGGGLGSLPSPGQASGGWGSYAPMRRAAAIEDDWRTGRSSNPAGPADKFHDRTGMRFKGTGRAVNLPSSGVADRLPVKGPLSERTGSLRRGTPAGAGGRSAPVLR